MTIKPINRLSTENENGFLRVLLIGDLHSGSDVAVKHPNFVSNNNDVGKRIKIPNNKIQNIFYDEWKNMRNVVGHCDLVVLMGDMTDGVNYKEEGIGTWTTSMDEQISNAVMLLNEIDADKFIGIKGSRYHIKDNMTADELVLMSLGDNKNKITQFFDDKEVTNDQQEYDGLHIDYDMRLELEDLNFNLRHWLSTTKSTFMYRPTKIAREMLKLQTAIATLGEYDFVIRAHVHTYTYLDIMSEIVGITLPAWKGRDDYAKMSISESASHGWVLIDIDGDRFTKYNRSFTLPIEFNIKTVSYGRPHYKENKHKDDLHIASVKVPLKSKVKESKVNSKLKVTRKK
jgi:hypothetical protein